jgi:hypothetical protein
MPESGDVANIESLADGKLAKTRFFIAELPSTSDT